MKNTKTRIIFFSVALTYNLLLGFYLRDFLVLSSILQVFYLLSALPTLFLTVKDILLTKMPRRSVAKITSQLDNLRIPYNRKCLPAKSVAFQLLLKECKYMYCTYC